MKRIKISAVFESTYTALLVTLVLSGVALSGKLSVWATWILLLAAWVVAIVGLRKRSIRAKITYAVLIGVVLALFAYWARPDVIPSWTGVLKPDQQTRKVLFSPSTHAHMSMLEIGDSGVRLSPYNPSLPLISFAEDQGLTIELIDGTTKVSTQVRDKNGNLVAELYRNEWKVAPPPRTWDRNYSNNALEIRSPDGSIILQVKVLADRVQLQGEWWRDAIHGWRLVSLGQKQGGALVIFGPSMPPSKAPKIRPIFAYPSEMHLGQLLE